MAAVPEAEVKAFVDDFAQSAPAAKAQVLQQLRREQSHDTEAPFCARMGCLLVSPCRLSSCTYSVKDSKAFNCRLTLKGKERNEICDVAAAFDVDESTARQMLARALSHVREASLEEAVVLAGVNRFTMVRDTGVCVVCSGTTETPYKTLGGFCFCSKACFREKPPTLFRLEHRYGADVRHVLKLALDTFKTIPLISSTLRIPRASLLRFYEFYLGVKPSSFGVDVADIVDLLRKKTGDMSPDFIVVNKEDLRTYPVWASLEAATLGLVRTL